MKNQDNSPQEADDVLGRATDALRETHVPEGPPAAVVEAVLASNRPSENNKQTRFQMGRFNMNRIAKIAATIIIVIGIGITITLLTQGNGTATVAWAQVVKQINHHTKYKCRQRVVRKEGPQIPTMQVYHLNLSQRRQELDNGDIHIIDMRGNDAITVELQSEEKKGDGNQAYWDKSQKRPRHNRDGQTI